jgi:acetoin utilization deacetylase AcuC-like enzyme
VAGHPESPDRVEVVASHLTARGMMDDRVVARDATDAELLRVHAPEYLELVKRECAARHEARYLSTGDVVIDDASLAVARRAAGGAIAAAEAAVRSKRPAFALVRRRDITPKPRAGWAIACLTTRRSPRALFCPNTAAES